MIKELRTRRDFIIGFFRYFILALIALVTGVFIKKKKIVPVSGNDCINNGLCSNCAVLNDCRLPRAAGWQ